MSTTREDVRTRLESLLDTLPVGGRLPGERELAARLGVARMTLRRTVDAFVLDGRLERRPGSGTYLVRPAMARVAGLTSFTEDVTHRGARAGGRVVEFRQRAASVETATRLSMPVGDPVLRITRVRTADAEPVAVESVDIPAAYVPGLAADDVSGSLYAVLRERFGISLGSATMTLAAELPDRRTAELLEVTMATPCLYVEMTDVDHRGRTVMLARCHYRSDRYRMAVQLVDDARRTT